MIQEIPYAGWTRNLRLQGPTTELVLTLDIGPRVIRYAFTGGKNVFVNMAGQMGGVGESEWLIRGGHRFWTAPEADHSYDPDNGPVTWQPLAETGVELIQPVSKRFGFQKTMRVELLAEEIVKVTHVLTNAGDATLDVSPWTLSAMQPGGVALFPQPRLDLHPSEFPEGRATKPEDFLPNRELVLWPFTDLADGRFAFSENFLRVTYLPEMRATKLGLKLPTGWAAYQNGDTVFAKHFAYDVMKPYPDRGVNFEIFTDHHIVEMETLAPSFPLAPGAQATHVEHWVLRHTTADLLGDKEALAFFAALPEIA